MPSAWIENLGPGFHPNAPTDEAAIARVEAELGVSFPDDYREFLLASNGGYTASVNLFAIGELVTPHSIQIVREWYPGFVPIGNNGAGESIAFDTRRAPWRIAIVPCIGDTDDAVARSASFRDFLESVARGESIFPPTG